MNNNECTVGQPSDSSQRLQTDPAAGITGDSQGTSAPSTDSDPTAAQRARWARIPHALRDRPQWVLAGPDKVPRTVSGDNASSTDSTTWSDFDSACRAAIERGLGIGYVLHKDDPFTCIDFDVCNEESQKRKGQPIDREEWTTEAEMADFWKYAQEIGSYTEKSLNGGLHIWVRAETVKGYKRKPLEIYSQGRYILCTGIAVIDCPIEDRQDEVTRLAAHMDDDKLDTVSIVLEEIPPEHDDDTILAKARDAANGDKFKALWAGDWKAMGYGSQSEADFALLGILTFSSPSNAQVRRLFRLSGLGQRKKAQRNDYLNYSLKQFRSQQAAELQAVEHGRQIAEALLTAWEKSTIERVAAESSGFKFKFARPGGAILQIDYFIDPWLPRATVIGCYGRGEAGKSSWTAQICAEASKQTSTLWVSSEERQDHILQRHLSCRGEVDTLVVIEALPTKTNPHTKKALATSFNIYDHMEPAIKALKQNPEARKDRPLGVVVLDAVVALVTWGKGETANDDGGVKRLIAFLCVLAERYGVTFIILGHLNKGSSHDHIADAVTGAAAWTNSVRLAYMFVKDMESERYEGFIRTAKSNTGTHFGTTYRTVPVYTLRERPDGKNDVLCGAAMIGPTVWGELALREMMAGEDDAWLNKREQKHAKVQALVDGTLHMLRTGPSTTRKVVEGLVKEKVTRRHWLEAEGRLSKHGVQVENMAHGERIYSFVRTT